MQQENTKAENGIMSHHQKNTLNNYSEYLKIKLCGVQIILLKECHIMQVGGLFGIKITEKAIRQIVNWLGLHLIRQ